MAKVFKSLLLLMVVAAMVWLAMLWRWYQQDAEPNAIELAVYLVAVPVVLTLGLMVCLWQIKKLRAFAGAPLVMPKLARAAARPAAPEALPAGALVLWAEGKSILGPEWDAGREAAAAGGHAPKLHARLVDNQGLPAFAAEVDNVYVEDTRDAWEAFVAAGAEEAPQAAAWAYPPDEWYRTMALLSPLVSNALQSLREQWEVLSASLRQPAAGDTPHVCIELAIPARWQSLWQQAAEVWVRYQMAPCIGEGLKAAGQSGAMAGTPQAVIQFTAHPVEDAASFWDLVDQRQRQWVDQNVPCLSLVLAGDSLLSQSQVSALDAQQGLMTARRAKGRIPGEAAAALLLATPAWLQAPGYPGTPALASLHAAASRRRDKSADGKGAADSTLLLQLAQEALAAQKIPVDLVKHMTADADHRSNRQAELHGLFDTFADLDAVEDVLCSGVACGDTGVARWLFTVALAVDKVQNTQSPGLVLGNFDEWQRLALLLTPEPFERPADVNDPESKAA